MRQTLFQHAIFNKSKQNQKKNKKRNIPTSDFTSVNSISQLILLKPVWNTMPDNNPTCKVYVHLQ